MIVSIFPNGQIVYGVDYSHIAGVTVEEVSESDFTEASEQAYTLDNKQLYDKKYEEMLYLIHRRYPIDDQLFIIMGNDPADPSVDFTAMYTFISGIRAELDENGKDADFSDWE